MDIPLSVGRLPDNATPAKPLFAPRRRTLIVAASLALLATVGIAGYLLSGTAAHPAYRVATVTRGPVTASIIASGTVNPVTSVLVGSQVSGQIKQLDADFNSRVSKGQLVARIDPALFDTQAAQARADMQVAMANVAVQQATAERAQADLDGARATLESFKTQTQKASVAAQDSWRIADRARRLAETGAGTLADRDTTQAIYDQAAAQVHTAQAQEAVQHANIASAQAAIDTAQVNLDHTYIRVPVDGTVVLRNVDVGQTVVASLQAPLIFTIAQDLSRMQVDASVDEADVGGVKVGQAVTFGVDAYPGRAFQGSVQQVRIAPQVVQNVVTYDVVVSAPNADLALLPGLTANTRVITDHRDDALLIPNAALRYRPPGTAGAPQGGKTGEVWAAGSNGHPVAVKLRLGISDGNVTEVVEGALQSGAQIIIGEAPAGTPTTAQSSPGVTAGPRF